MSPSAFNSSSVLYLYLKFAEVFSTSSKIFRVQLSGSKGPDASPRGLYAGKGSHISKVLVKY